MITVTLSVEHLKSFKAFQANDERIEYNGEIGIDESTGAIRQIIHRKGQYLEPCTKGCIINWHTHPQDYTRYFPEHPSAQDMKYVLFAVSKTRELVAHMIFTPSFVYVITLSQQMINLPLEQHNTKSFHVDELFKRVSDLHADRSTNEFRAAWLNGLRRMGFVIQQFSGYDQPITITLRRINPKAVRLIEADGTQKNNNRFHVVSAMVTQREQFAQIGVVVLLVCIGAGAIIARFRRK